MKKILVTYFSASGVTKKVAETLAKAEDADLFEIRPEVLYTPEDLDWRDEKSRSTLEMADPSCRPAVVGHVDAMDQYDVVFIGFPIWWGREPSVVDTFLDAHDFSGKKVVLFCTAGSGNMGSTAKRVDELDGSAVTIDGGKLFADQISEESLKIWAEELLK